MKKLYKSMWRKMIRKETTVDVRWHMLRMKSRRGAINDMGGNYCTTQIDAGRMPVRTGWSATETWRQVPSQSQHVRPRGQKLEGNSYRDAREPRCSLPLLTNGGLSTLSRVLSHVSGSERFVSCEIEPEQLGIQCHQHSRRQEDMRLHSI